jgi:hypothetical protein
LAGIVGARANAADIRRQCCRAVAKCNVTFGANAATSSSCVIKLRSIPAALIAVTETGTSWMDSARLRAMTTISSEVSISSEASAAAAGLGV